MWLHSRHGGSCRESTYEISRGHEKLKRVQGSGITSGGRLYKRRKYEHKDGGNANRPGRSAFLMCYCITSFLAAAAGVDGLM